MNLAAWAISAGSLGVVALLFALWWQTTKRKDAETALAKAQEDRDVWVKVADQLERQLVMTRQIGEARRERLESVNEEFSRRLLERDAEVEAIVRDIEETHGAVSARELLERLRKTSPASTPGGGIVVSV